VTTAVDWRRRWLETGRAAAKPRGGATNNRIKGEDAASLVALVEAEDDLKLHAVQTRHARSFSHFSNQRIELRSGPLYR
jgi:transposase